MISEYNNSQNKELIEFLEQVDPDWRFFLWQLDITLNEIEVEKNE